MKKRMTWIGNLLILSGLAVTLIVSLGLRQNDSAREGRLDAFAAIQAEAGAAPNKLEAADVSPGSEIQDIEGILSIPTIDLKEPIMMGVDESVLSTGLGAIEGMDAPGAPDGSYAIAGHQTYAFGEFFNRLDELEIGERFTFETTADILQYEIFDIQKVRPDQVEVLDRQPGLSLLSLITCYPKRSNEYRLVVQAKLIE
ncbi:class D sortase [Sporosarcina sp. FSL W7-1349]|uniref:class D sortase n=1 Tax=Sporosarcina sp. FSL W7-1349 TaxID=2921561 RepID=UPI0030F7C04D